MAREATSPVGSPKIRDTFVYFVLQARTGCWGFHFKDSHSSFAAGWRPSSSPSPSLLHHTITIPPLSPALLNRCTPWSCRLTHITHHITHTALSHI